MFGITRWQAIKKLLFTVFILYLVGSLFSWSFSYQHWNWFSKIVFGLPTVVLTVWTITDYFISPDL